MLQPRIVFLACLGLVCGITVAEDGPDTKQLERWVEYYTEVAQGYDLRLKSAPDEPLTVSPKPILVYSNPTIGLDTHGAFFVWTRNGRAEAIAAIWSKRISAERTSLKNVNHEFHSLATEPLVAKGADGVTWQPETPGLEFEPVPGAPVPAASRVRRLTQMREISKQFIGFDSNPRQDLSGEEEERRMRILPTPLYRYAEPERTPNPKPGATPPPLVDGAIFGMFVDWDPEILLVLEVRPTAEGPRWHYGVAYVDYKPLWLHHNDKEVWSKRDKGFGHARFKYFCVIGVKQRPRELE